MNRRHAVAAAGLIALTCAVAVPAEAQSYRCVDSAGRVSYSDKGGAGCQLRATAAGPASTPARNAGTPGAGGRPANMVPLVPEAPGTAKAGKKPAAKAEVVSAETREQLASRCGGMRQEHAWLSGPRGEGAPGREARLAQLQKAMASCP